MKMLTDRYRVLIDFLTARGDRGANYNECFWHIKGTDKLALFNKKKTINNSLSKLMKWGLVRLEPGEIRDTYGIKTQLSPRYYIMSPIDIARKKLDGQTKEVADKTE